MDTSKKQQKKKKSIMPGAFGYIATKKKSYLCRVGIYAAIGIAIFVFGLLVNKFDHANIFTILAILMVLPAAKAMVAVIVFARFKTVSSDRYQAVFEATTANLSDYHSLKEVMASTSVIDSKVTLLTDVVFTSVDKVMNLDFALLTEHGFYGLVGKSNQDVSYMTNYLKDTLKEHHNSCEVKLTEKEDKFLSYARAIGANGVDDDAYNEKVVKTIETLIVK
ncbi:MAG: hypothetical protein Q4F05_06925 [bacterium]|nr:hypothetical protein [bacterium]